MKPLNRRSFLHRIGQTLGGSALALTPGSWLFAAQYPGSDLVHRTTKAMGTAVRISVPTSHFSDHTVDGALSAVHDIDRLLTTHRLDSVLMQMNRHVGSWTDDPTLATVAARAIELGHLTEGALDVTVLPLLQKYGFVPKHGSAHLPEIIQTADFTQLEVQGHSARLNSDDHGVDFGGIAKGFAVDQAATTARRDGIEAALIDAGGDLFALGRPTVDSRWKIGVRHPFQDGELVATVEVEDEAVATSGLFEQQRMIDGKQFSHLFDPRTGESVNHVVSATIIARDAMTADALATATSVMAPKASVALINSLPAVEGFWVYPDRTHTMSNGIKSRLQLV